MNKNKLKRALLHFSNGKTIRDIEQFIDIEAHTLKHKFDELGIKEPIDARRAYENLEKTIAEQAIHNNRRSKEDKGGQIVPEFKPEPAKHEFKFDRAAAIVNDKEEKTQEKIPLAEQQTFREELRTRPWKHIVKKWTERYKLTENQLMEQAILLSPIIAKDRFGFVSDDNMENKKPHR